MKIGISSACFYPDVLTEDSIKLMKNIGFDVGEVFLNTYSEYKDDFIEKLKEEKDKNNFYINSIHAFSAAFEPNLFDKYKRRQRDMLKIFEMVCKGVKKLDAKYYNFHGMRLSNLLNLDIKHVIDVYNELCYIASENEITLVQENVSWCMSSNTTFLKILKENCKYPLGYTLDIKQAYKSGGSPLKYIDIMKEDLMNVHINDRDEKNICLLPGNGNIKYEDIYGKLKDIGYNNVCNIEVYKENYVDYSELKKSKDFLANIFI